MRRARRSRQALNRAGWGAGLVLALAGCKHNDQDFRTPQDRITTDTAYTLEKRQTRVELGAGGHDFGLDDTGVGLTVRHGIIDRLEVGTNVAHDAVSLFNLDVRGTLVDRPRFGLGARVGAKWLPFQALYLLPKDIRDDFGGLHFVVLPVDMTFSFPVLKRFAFHITPGYFGSAVFGSVDSDGVDAIGQLGWRQVYIDNFYNVLVGRRVALVFGLHFPLWTVGLTDARASTEVQPGVEAIAETGEWQPVPFARSFRSSAGVEVYMGRRAGMRANVLLPARLAFVYRRVEGVPDWTPGASLSFYWRFGGSLAKPRRGDPDASTPPAPTPPAPQESTP